MPKLNLDDPVVQDDVRNTVVPVRVIDQLRKLGSRAYRGASLVDAPVLVIQGTRDELVPQQATLRLMQRFPRQPGYLELDLGHDLIDPSRQEWSRIEEAVLDFAQTVSSQ
jgi:esterase/lipase